MFASPLFYIFPFLMLLQITVVEDHIHKVETKFNILSWQKTMCKILIADIHKNFIAMFFFDEIVFQSSKPTSVQHNLKDRQYKHAKN